MFAIYNHKEVADFAVEKVNLPQDTANEYRAQARDLREKLERYITDNPDFNLKKMILSGSLAESTSFT